MWRNYAQKWNMTLTEKTDNLLVITRAITLITFIVTINLKNHIGTCCYTAW